MEWIDIKNECPSFGIPVIVCGEGRICIARLVKKGITIDSVTLYFHEGDSGVEDLWITPTHWMPLPALPPVASK